MAVKPEDCLHVTKDEEALVFSLEKEIDAYLMLHFTSIDATVDFKLPQDAFNRMNSRTFNYLRNIYTNAGWTVSQISKTIDKVPGNGNYLQFKKYQSPSSGYFDR